LRRERDEGKRKGGDCTPPNEWLGSVEGGMKNKEYEIEHDER